MRTTILTLAFGSLVLSGACIGEVDEGEGLSTEEIGAPLVEESWFNGRLCSLNFVGATSNNADFYYFWNIGTNGRVDAPYNTARPNLYAIFGTSAPAEETHHVDGFDAYDHYHVADSGPDEADYDTTWDLIVAFPGPNYDAATYVTAHDEAQLFAQFSSGVLAGPLLLHEVGFDDIVLKVPLVCAN